IGYFQMPEDLACLQPPGGLPHGRGRPENAIVPQARFRFRPKWASASKSAIGRAWMPFDATNTAKTVTMSNMAGKIAGMRNKTVPCVLKLPSHLSSPIDYTLELALS
ncbi:MAG: hypothetical protein ACOYMG_17310, partial [Candidatus Methylumidiphilus sp.]